MTNLLEDKNDKKLLSREDILAIDLPKHDYQLPSGKTINVTDLKWGFTIDLLKEYKIKEHNVSGFTKEVIDAMLQSNDQNSFTEYSDKDQIILVEIAAEHLGCKNEYDELQNVLILDKRLYEAFLESNKKLTESFVKRIEEINNQFYEIVRPFTSFSKTIINTTDLSSVFEVTRQLNETIIPVNHILVEQMSTLNRIISEGFELMIRNLTRSLDSIFEHTLFYSFEETIERYNYLIDGGNHSADNFVSIFELTRPPMEMLDLSIGVELAITGEVIEEPEIIEFNQSDKINDWLMSLDEAFSIMFEGAHQTIYSTNPDRCRHFASSHRELLTQLLHYFAPDEDIKIWIKDPNYYDNGRPTRKARIKYFARDKVSDSFSDFFYSLVKTHFDLLNADQHKKSHEYSEAELMIFHKEFQNLLLMFMEVLQCQ